MSAAEAKDRGRQLPKKRLLDYSKMTEGELKLNLLLEQLEILSSYYPEIRDFSTQRDILKEVLSSSLGQIPGGKESRFIRQVVNKAKGQTQPAAFKIYGREVGPEQMPAPFDILKFSLGNF